MPREMSNAEKIRDWVAEFFGDVGEFRTADVASNIEGVEVKATGNISAALTTWVEEQKIVRGLRMRRLSDKGRTAVWVCEKIGRREATGASVEKPVPLESLPHVTMVSNEETFVAKIINRQGNNGSMLIEHEGKLFKVVPFKY